MKVSQNASELLGLYMPLSLIISSFHSGESRTFGTRPRTHMSRMIMWSTEFWNFFVSSAFAFLPATRNGARFRVPCLVTGEASAPQLDSEGASSCAPSEPVQEELTASLKASISCALRCRHLTECLRIRARWRFPAARWSHSGAIQEYERFPSLLVCLITRRLRRSSFFRPFVLVFCRFKHSKKNHNLKNKIILQFSKQKPSNPDSDSWDCLTDFPIGTSTVEDSDRGCLLGFANGICQCHLIFRAAFC